MSAGYSSSGLWRHGRGPAHLTGVRKSDDLVYAFQLEKHWKQEGLKANSLRDSSQSGMARRGPALRDGGRWLLQEFGHN